MATTEEGDVTTPAESSSGGGRLWGRLHEYRPEGETFAVYMERVAIFFAANDIAENKKVPLLLNCIGGTVYGVLRNLVAPQNPISMSYDDVTKKLLEHFDPKPLTIVERFHFHKRDQASTESLADYLAELRRLATKCNFGPYLDEALRDRFVCGIKSEAIQRKLLSESDIDLTKAFQLATTMESAHANTLSLQAPASVVAQVDPHPIETSKTQASPCTRCGRKGHSPSGCWARELTCHRCKKRGHLSRVCRSARGRSNPSPGRNYQIEAEPEEVDLISTVYTVKTARTMDPYKATLEVNGKPLCMEIDTSCRRNYSTITDDVRNYRQRAVVYCGEGEW